MIFLAITALITVLTFTPINSPTESLFTRVRRIPKYYYRVREKKSGSCYPQRRWWLSFFYHTITNTWGEEFTCGSPEEAWKCVNENKAKVEWEKNYEQREKTKRYHYQAPNPE